MGYTSKKLHSKIAIELSEWMDEIKSTQRSKASKLLKLVDKYENMYKPKKIYSSPPPDEF